MIENEFQKKVNFRYFFYNAFDILEKILKIIVFKLKRKIELKICKGNFFLLFEKNEIKKRFLGQ